MRETCNAGDCKDAPFAKLRETPDGYVIYRCPAGHLAVEPPPRTVNHPYPIYGPFV